MKLWASTSGTRHGTRTTRSREASAGTTSSALVTAPPTRQTQPPLVRQWAPRRKCGKSAPRRRSSKTLLFLRAFLAFVRRRPPVELLSAVLRAVACSAPPPLRSSPSHHMCCMLPPLACGADAGDVVAHIAACCSPISVAQPSKSSEVALSFARFCRPARAQRSMQFIATPVSG